MQGLNDACQQLFGPCDGDNIDYTRSREPYQQGAENFEDPSGHQVHHPTRPTLPSHPTEEPDIDVRWVQRAHELCLDNGFTLSALRELPAADREVALRDAGMSALDRARVLSVAAIDQS